jgi:uncharacterized membrane protein
MKKIQKFIFKVEMAVLGAVLCLPLVGNIALAAVDADVASGTDAIVDYATDNKPTMVAFFISLGLLGLSVSLVIMAVVKGSAWIKRAFMGGRKRR